MNVTYYLAVERLALGTAAALLYLGAFLVALTAIDRVSLLIWPLLALVGVLLLTGPANSPSTSTGPAGWVFGALAAASLAVYTTQLDCAGDLGSLGDIALATGVSAILLAPFIVAGPPPPPAAAFDLVLLGTIGVAVPFACDYVAMRLSGPALVGTLFAFDPVAGVLVGFAALGQAPTVPALAGIAAICLAGAALTTSLRPARRPQAPT